MVERTQGLGVLLCLLGLSISALGQSTRAVALPDLKAQEPNSDKADLALEIKTIEVMVDQLEKMPRSTKEEKNAWYKLYMEIGYTDRFKRLVTYETKDNLDLWVLIGRWATAEGVTETKSLYADEPLFHIRRLRPDYQKDAKLFDLVAKLNAISDPYYKGRAEYVFRNFQELFEDHDLSDPNVQLKIADAYMEPGNGIFVNPHESLKWCQLAAKAGNVDALAELGSFYLYGLGGLKEDAETGERLLQQALKKGSDRAAIALGGYYTPSERRKGDRKKAIEMFRFAAERGNSDAFSPLAALYVEVGNGREALRWANGGDEPNESDEKAHMQWKMGRSFGDYRGRCTYIKGEVYALGVGDVEQDLAQAKALLEEAYRKGGVRAACLIAAMYREGIGVDRDMAKAEQWKEDAARTLARGDSTLTKASSDYCDKQIEEFAEKLRAASAKRK